MGICGANMGRVMAAGMFSELGMIPAFVSRMTAERSCTEIGRERMLRRGGPLCMAEEFEPGTDADPPARMAAG